MRSAVLALAPLLALALVACKETPPAPQGERGAPATRITVYSGRSEKLVGPILAAFEQQRGIKLEIRYGETAALATLLLEEGKRSPA
ncbi:MAG TPA: hypothetical protein VK932_25765, partial [Kofleriaceae bacterium]|nr:hypothetical protein [Kofleriaceae bacterium]